jgi:alpha-D-xyloside xylohydrolase
MLISRCQRSTFSLALLLLLV